jgi:hypothetical protein
MRIGLGGGIVRKKVCIVLIAGIMGIYQNLFAQSWEKTIRLTWNSSTSSCPKIATDSNDDIHVVWQDNYRIFYKRSTNGGAAWAGAKRLAWNLTKSYPPSIASDSNNHVHVVWYDWNPGNGELYYNRSTNGGVSWIGTKRLTWSDGDSYATGITTDSSDNIHVVWEEGIPLYSGFTEIFYKRSTDGGATWLGSERLTWSSSHSGWAAIAAGASGYIHVVWNSDVSGNYEIYYKRSTDGGGNWSWAKRLTWNAGDSRQPAIAVSGNDIYVVWYDISPGNTEIFYKKSANGGITWYGTKRLTWNALETWRPEVVIDPSNHVHIVWQDETSGNYEIYHRKSTNGGAAWTAAKRLTWNSGLSIRPKIAADSLSDLHLVWEDNSPGNYEIFYKKGVKK